MNWAKNARVRAVFVEGVKILENKPFAQNCDFQSFGGNVDICGMGPISGVYTPIFFLLPYDCLFFGWYHVLHSNPDFWFRKSKIPIGGKYPLPPC